jgi:hypothetical protein
VVDRISVDAFSGPWLPGSGEVLSNGPLRLFTHVNHSAESVPAINRSRPKLRKVYKRLRNTLDEVGKGRSDRSIRFRMIEAKIPDTPDVTYK